MKASLNWLNNMQFSCDNRGLKTSIDAPKDSGGDDTAPTPKEFVLNAMMGCTAMDVVSLLRKMRQEINEFKMEIEAEKNLDHPIHFKHAELIYYLKGNMEIDKVIKAVDLSLTKYCGVNFMISKTCEIKYKIFLNEKMIKQGSANFN